MGFKVVVAGAALAVVLSGCASQKVETQRDVRATEIMEKTRHLIAKRVETEQSAQQETLGNPTDSQQSQDFFKVSEAVMVHGARVEAGDHGLTLWLPERIEFDFDDARVSELRVTEALAAFINAYPEQLMLRISGHTDQPGTDEYNQRLGMKRAAEVSRALIEAGVPAEQIILVSKAATEPRTATPNPAQENRRAEFELLLENSR